MAAHDLALYENVQRNPVGEPEAHPPSAVADTGQMKPEQGRGQFGAKRELDKWQGLRSFGAT